MSEWGNSKTNIVCRKQGDIIMLRKKTLVLLLLTAIPHLSLAAGSRQNTLYTKDFGVIGDGVSDDGPAIRKAIAAAIVLGPGTRLVFESKVYRLDAHPGGGSQMELRDVTGLAIEGNGSTLLLHPRNGILDVRRCKNVVFKGFVINFVPLPFTQGTIQSVNADQGYFDLELHDNYPLPPSDAIVKQRRGVGGWRWGSVMDPVERHRRWDVSDHFYVASVNKPEHAGPRTYRIEVIASYADRLVPVRPGDRFFLPLQLTERGESISGSNFRISESSDCTVEDITIHAARSGMNFGISRNEGTITLRNNRIAFAPGSTHVCTTWKDGIHCKDNRVGPVIEDFYFEGMLDDSINISANTAMARKVHSTTEFTIHGATFSPGDEVMVFDPQSGKILAETTILKEKAGRRFVLADAIEGVVAGSKRRADIKSTHFYNMSYVNTGFIIRNCTFMPQRRHAMLIRSSNGLIEGNTIKGVGGAAVWMGNEMGSFYEGPFPQNNTIRNNTIHNTQLPAIRIYTSSLTPSAKHTRDIKVENNTITVLTKRLGISVSRAENIELKGNHIFDQHGNEIGDAGLQRR